MNFIDIHGHYAWDIDDGIASKEEAIEALKIAKDNDINIIVATPHVIPGVQDEETIKKIKNRILEFKQLAKEYGILVIEGGELFLNHSCVDFINNKMFIPFENTKYVLVEFDVRKELGASREVEDYLFELEVNGYTPIIAHVERYFHKKIDLERVKKWVNQGYLIQVNAPSLLGIHGSTTKNNAYKLIDEGLAHFIATDTHTSSGKRTPCLKQAYEQLRKDYDESILEILMYRNAKNILNNKEVQTYKINKSLFSKLFKRR